MNILVLNAGSSSQKSCLYALPDDGLPEHPLDPLWEAQLDWSQRPGEVVLSLKSAGEKQEQSWPSPNTPDHRRLDTQRMLETLWQGESPVMAEPGEIAVVGHRVVHGGDRYRQSCWVDPTVSAEIQRLSRFAPLHNPANWAGIDLIEHLFPRIPQVAVFDTAFHSTLPPAAFTYPGPQSWLDQGIRRYGFHGISHQYCAQRAAQLLGRDLGALNLITAHLGNGCSLAAIAAGQCRDTTMGFTPLEGLMMGSRSGSVDPGILIHLLRQGYSVEELERQLNRESGLLGLSGLSADMRAILAAVQAGEERATLALGVYVHRLRSLLGSLWLGLGHLDALVFTAGVGEHAALVREQACANLESWGLRLDPTRNATLHPDTDIAMADSQVRVLLIHTQEDWAIACDCWSLMRERWEQEG